MAVAEVMLTETVLLQARKLGMYGNVSGRLKAMVQQSMPFTHPSGNRRFEGYVLRVDKNDDGKASLSAIEKIGPRPAPAVPPPIKGVQRVVYASAMECKKCHGTMTVLMFDSHDACGGLGCAGCNYTREIGVPVPCPAQQSGLPICPE
jgi:hypothetical protein